MQSILRSTQCKVTNQRLCSGCCGLGIAARRSEAPTGHSPKAHQWSQPCVSPS